MFGVGDKDISSRALAKEDDRFGMEGGVFAMNTKLMERSIQSSPCLALRTPRTLSAGYFG